MLIVLHHGATAKDMEQIKKTINPDPEHALSDGPQSLRFGEFENLLAQVRGLLAFKKRKLPEA